MKEFAIKINPADNVAVALQDIETGKIIPVGNVEIELKSNVRMKHKFALQAFEAGNEIKMYGVTVGSAVCRIEQGEAINTENVQHKSTAVIGKTETSNPAVPDVTKWKSRSFKGYLRSDGQAGTRNVWLFFPLVFCENKNIETLREVFDNELLISPVSPYQRLLHDLIEGKQDVGTFYPAESVKKKRVFENIEVKFITHDGGCGNTRQEALDTARLLAGYMNNPNVAGATILSLGCQNLQKDLILKEIHAINMNFDKPLLIFDHQNSGSTDQMLSRAIAESFAAIKKANQIQRTEVPLSKLRIGLECGGSDGFSGISANPLLGLVSDKISALGGCVILSEFPELCGVEQDIVNRCTNDADGVRFLKLMKEYEENVVRAGSGFHMNPSPGNIKDGLITDAMKSAGAAKKGGSSLITGVYDYGEYITKPGLSLLCTPGNDVVSTTALAGSGANLVLFTTGLGTPTGNPVTPVIKVASNSVLATRMPDIIDFNAGRLISKNATLEILADELLEQIISIASGETLSKSDINRQYDFLLWNRSVAL